MPESSAQPLSTDTASVAPPAQPSEPVLGAVEEAPSSWQVQLLPLAWRDPWRWLARGAQDVRRAWGVALFYGLCFWGMALVLGWMFRARPEYVMSLVSGCLLLGPFLAMGLYDTSRRLEQGLAPDLGSSITSWDRNLGGMAMLVLVLIVLELLWGRASLVVFAVFFHTGMPSTAGVLQTLLQPENWEFIAVYTAVGGVFALLVYGLSAVAMPLMLERGTDALTACITSMRVVQGNLGVMLLWGVMLTVVIVASLLVLQGVLLVVTGPVLGCATWHAYRSAMQPVDRGPAAAAETDATA